ncbi:unnamed protein product [Schistosoma margrebowiei]|uniref:Uncharacterized protein n=1 Tax=Schistosoma margrebowiei TaxID=48269 RepID=A0A183N059_9TREM|nr:unnamed protein product [Schistosoma margrebowiei]
MANQLETLDIQIQKTRLDIEKLIGETNAGLKNHGVQSDEGKLSNNNNIETMKLLNLVIECRRMFYENEHGARIFDVEAANRNGSACYINLPPQHIEERRRFSIAQYRSGRSVG